jgi:hypothetical protein
VESTDPVLDADEELCTELVATIELLAEAMTEETLELMTVELDKDPDPDPPFPDEAPGATQLVPVNPAGVVGLDEL